MIAHPLTWIEVSSSALSANVSHYKRAVGNATLAPVIKSNAYGHGLELVGSVLEQHSDVGLLCVISISEALALRAAGNAKPILVLSILDCRMLWNKM
jgi:alanine racemase